MTPRAAWLKIHREEQKLLRGGAPIPHELVQRCAVAYREMLAEGGEPVDPETKLPLVVLRENQRDLVWTKSQHTRFLLGKRERPPFAWARGLSHEALESFRRINLHYLPRPANRAAAAHTGSRARGRRRSASRSSAKARDSGGDDGPEPPRPTVACAWRPIHVAARLSLPLSTTYDLIRSGNLPSIRVGRGTVKPRLLVREDDLARFLEQRRRAAS